MEFLGAFPDGEWDSLGKMFSTEELEFMPHFLGQFSFPLDHNEGLNLGPSTFCPNSEATMGLDGVNESLFHSLDSFNSNMHYISQESSFSSCATPTQRSYNFSDSYQIPVIDNISMDVCMMDETNVGSYIPAFTDIVMGETVCIKQYDGSPDQTVSGNELQLKRKYDVCTGAEDKSIDTDSTPQNLKKKPRVSRKVPKSKKRAGSKKRQKQASNGKDEESNTQSTSSYSSEDDNASLESNGGLTSDTKPSAAVNLNGKTRASRGSATDPQSLYARKRRERINERLRILQNLVPNGTKVDISTMLEEAVHYVKFMQLQIKLLSSEDLWMYAPIAYNGVDIGFNQKISPLL
ncbi:hypothetical protein FEM48_ZijujUnG0066100 [Ziziphus jujuba var. spinosa]|uniref:BHLH domain-containing protein n=1 Tax=Ziziphus jujuba var. spinosa TaxID=714518 RepID=A0A978U8X4_ZIZJJ|nr:hypothetical protein FEM48_ZijujUnG0066100 [Ziziphus jujuba var. spinosa]